MIKRIFTQIIFLFLILFVGLFFRAKTVSALASGNVTSVCNVDEVVFTIEVSANGGYMWPIYYLGTELTGDEAPFEGMIDPNIVPTPIPSSTQFNIPIPLNVGAYSLGDTVTIELHAFEADPDVNPDDRFFIGTPTSFEQFSCVVEESPNDPVPTGVPSGGNGPYPAPFVPCNDERPDDPGNNEFHTLRPYQASPCDTDLTSLNLYCGNDLILKDTITVSPADAESCEELDDGSYQCHFEMEREATFSIGLIDAELPILGNTQLVPNQVNNGNPQPEQFSWARRVNEYLSWYLNGAPWKADEPLMDPDEMNDDYPYRHIEQYAGPIRKLLPNAIQRDIRLGQRAQAQDTRHNQIILCIDGVTRTPCWNNYSIDHNGTFLPPAYPVDTVRVESPDQQFTGWGLMSTTEDRLGQIFVNETATIQPNAGEGNEVTINDLVFDIDTENDLLYFAHTGEVSELAKTLQQTYIPYGIGGGVGHSYPKVAYNTERCELEDVRWNTGDDLFGELNSAPGGSVTDDTGDVINGEDINGSVTYIAEFDHTWNHAPVCDEEIYQLCMAGCVDPSPYPDCHGMCLDRCTPDTATAEVDALTAISVFTRSPKVDEIWKRTVAGNASWVRRMFPRLGFGGMVAELPDYPAVTSAEYISDVTALAGNPTTERSGSDAEIFIPHLGGVYEFAMIGMQDLLRPYIMNSQFLRNGLPPGSGDTGQPPIGSCTPASDDSACAPQRIADIIRERDPSVSPDEALIRGTNAAMICRRESNARIIATNTACTRGTAYGYAVGLFQVNLLAGRHPGPGNGQNSRCPDYPGGRNDPFGEVSVDPIMCEIERPDILAFCSAYYIDPLREGRNSIDWMLDNSNNGTTWGPWCTPNPEWNARYGCGLCT